MDDVTKRVDASSGHHIYVPLSVVRDVRSNILDYAHTNEIHEGEENSDERIARYINQTVDRFNGIPPILGSGIQPLALLMPMAGPIRSLIITGATARLLRSVMLKLARNDMPFTANNVTTQPNSVWRSMQAIIQGMEQEFDQDARQLKVAANLGGGWGGYGGAGNINALFHVPDGGWRAILTDMYDGVDSESMYVTI
jgi:hypothetical protein